VIIGVSTLHKDNNMVKKKNQALAGQDILPQAFKAKDVKIYKRKVLQNFAGQNISTLLY